MPKKILVIEDEKDYRELLSHILQKAGYEPVLASNGEEGLRAVAEGSPDMVLLDLNLPDTDGYEVCRRIREDPKRGKLPVIMVTVQSEMPNIVKGLRQGADDYLTKPFEAEEVLARVATLFRQSHG